MKAPANTPADAGAGASASESTKNAQSKQASWSELVAGLKQHLLVVLVGACIAVVGITVKVSNAVHEEWQARQARSIDDLKKSQAKLKARLAKLENPSPDAPVLGEVTITREVDGKTGAVKVVQDIAYKDPQGDAFFVAYTVLGSTTPSFSVESTSITMTEAAEQIRGARQLSTWNCHRNTYSLLISVTISDAAGHVSAPKKYTVRCEPDEAEAEPGSEAPPPPSPVSRASI